MNCDKNPLHFGSGGEIQLVIHFLRNKLFFALKYKQPLHLIKTYLNPKLGSGIDENMLQEKNIWQFSINFHL